jgi:hypothetical protein
VPQLQNKHHLLPAGQHPQEVEQLRISIPHNRPVATYAPIKMLSSLQNPRQAAAQLMNFGLILSTAFMVGFPHLCSAC